MSRCCGGDLLAIARLCEAYRSTATDSNVDDVWIDDGLTPGLVIKEERRPEINMSMSTMGKKKMNRWQAALLAGLVVAGGVVAVPQAASAATVTTTSTVCTSYASSCAKTKTARHGLIVFEADEQGFRKVNRSYTVKTTGGRTLCSGTITVNSGNPRQCKTGSYRGNVKLSIRKQEDHSMKIYATS